MDIQAALRLTDPKTLLEAAIEAETRNCETSDIRALYRLYYAALDREQSAARSA